MRMHGFVGVALALLSSAGIAAQQRSFVASTGNDANPCNLAQPCRTFSAAIAQTLNGGEVIVLDSAGYGPVTITKSVTIAAPPGVYAGITVSSGSGIAINGTGINVALRGLTVNGLGGSTGILASAAASVQIERCAVNGMSGNGIDIGGSIAASIRDTVVSGNGGHGIANAGFTVVERSGSERNGQNGFFTSGGATSIVDSTFNQNGLAGLYGAAKLVAERVVVHGNSSDGIGAFGFGSDFTIAGSTIEGNGVHGVAPAGGGHVHVRNSVVARNGTIDSFAHGILVPSTSKVTLESVKIIQNAGCGVSVDPSGTAVTFGNNAIHDNGGGGVCGSLSGFGFQ